MASRPDAAVSVELIEVTRGEWQLRISGSADVIGRAGDRTIPVRITVSPNLVPGVPFAAKMTVTGGVEVTD